VPVCGDSKPRACVGIQRAVPLDAVVELVGALRPLPPVAQRRTQSAAATVVGDLDGERVLVVAQPGSEPSLGGPLAKVVLAPSEPDVSE
jgi:hypothetical protein